MSVAQEIQRIAQAKADIRNAITAKGVKIADTDRIDTYANKVAQIEGGSGEGSGKYRVRFFDYDGTILKTVCTDGGEVTAPAVPEHERLLFQEWNNDFDNVTSDLDVGAIYTTKSGKCEFDIDINAQTGLIQYIGIALGSGTVTVEWGDGETETLSTIGNTRLSHTYATAGQYTILLSGTDSWSFLQKGLTEGDNNGANRSVVAMRLANIQYRVVYVQYQLADCFCCRLVSLDKSAVNFINYGLLRDNHSLRHINFPRGLKTSYWILSAGRSLKHAVLSDGDTEIAFSSFSSCALEDIVLPQSIMRIGDEAFQADRGFTQITEITIPPLVTEIKAGALFSQNATGKLRKVTMKPTTPPAIYYTGTGQTGSTFNWDGSLKEIIVPAGCGEAYKNATNWSYYADIIKEEEI